MNTIERGNSRNAWWYDGNYGTTPEAWAENRDLNAIAADVFEAVLRGQIVAVHVPTEKRADELLELLRKHGVRLDNVHIAAPPTASAERCESCRWHVVGFVGHSASCLRQPYVDRIIGAP